MLSSSTTRHTGDLRSPLASLANGANETTVWLSKLPSSSRIDVPGRGSPVSILAVIKSLRHPSAVYGTQSSTAAHVVESPLRSSPELRLRQVPYAAKERRPVTAVTQKACSEI